MPEALLVTFYITNGKCMSAARSLTNHIMTEAVPTEWIMNFYLGKHLTALHHIIPPLAHQEKLYTVCKISPTFLV